MILPGALEEGLKALIEQSIKDNGCHGNGNVNPSGMYDLIELAQMFSNLSNYILERMKSAY